MNAGCSTLNRGWFGEPILGIQCRLSSTGRAGDL
jgi:hypothetical protein